MLGRRPPSPPPQLQQPGQGQLGQGQQHPHRHHHHHFSSFAIPHPNHSHTHHHHVHVHRERDRERDRGSGVDEVDGGGSSSSLRKRARAWMSGSGQNQNQTDGLGTILAPSTDNNEWYYPAPPRPSSELDEDELEEEENSLPAGLRKGNWGNKLVRGSRWVRRGKIVNWGPGKNEWEMEEKARKRLKRIIPDVSSRRGRGEEESRQKRQRRSKSESPVRLPHLRSPTPPLVAPYTNPSLVLHPNFTSLVLSPSIQHSFTSKNMLELENTATELIEGEKNLRRAFGGFWRLLEGDLVGRLVGEVERERERAAREEGGTIGTGAGASRAGTAGMEGDAEGGGAGTGDMMDGIEGFEGEEFKTEERGDSPYQHRHDEPPLPYLHKLFISPTPLPLPPTTSMPGTSSAGTTPPKNILTPHTQMESLEWSLGVLRELADDGREYVERLQEIRDGLGRARSIRKVVWTECRLRALEDMDKEVV